MKYVFEWNENKRLKNIEKHGIDFADAVKIFDGFIHTYMSNWAEYDEERYVSIGLLEGVEIAVIYTHREGSICIISARRARKNERGMYHEEAEGNGNRLREAEGNER
mgnify:CR=1 FL=1